MRDIDKAVSAMQDVAYFVNEFKRDKESLEIISEIESSIEDLAMVSVSPIVPISLCIRCFYSNHFCFTA